MDAQRQRERDVRARLHEDGRERLAARVRCHQRSAILPARRELHRGMPGHDGSQPAGRPARSERADDPGRPLRQRSSEPRSLREQRHVSAHERARGNRGRGEHRRRLERSVGLQIHQLRAQSRLGRQPRCRQHAAADSAHTLRRRRLAVEPRVPAYDAKRCADRCHRRLLFPTGLRGHRHRRARLARPGVPNRQRQQHGRQQQLGRVHAVDVCAQRAARPHVRPRWPTVGPTRGWPM